MPFLGKQLARYRFRNLLLTILSLFALFCSIAEAGTIVRISTSSGDFSIELLEEEAPLTTQNFLNYVNRGNYNQTFIHRAISNFVVQGGGFTFIPFEGPIAVPSDPPVANEFNVSNTRGTVAMAKLDGEPNSATSQWFVNSVDNSANLDTTNGGFTVFATVLGNGMQTVDAINSLQKVMLGSRAPNAPYITPNYNDPRDFVYINMEVVDRFTEAVNVYESSSQLLFTSVNVDDGAELYSLNLSLLDSSENITFKVNADSVIGLASAPGDASTFSTTDNRLRIPSLELNLDGSIQTVSNVVLLLTSLADLELTLESFED